MDERLGRAIQNNVRWCDLVSRAHGAVGRSDEAWWSIAQPVPRFHPNFITTRPEPRAEQRRAVEALIEADFAPSFSVKDSFACLDLRELGFEKLFDANWIWRAGDAGLPESDAAIEWTRVSTREQLARFEASLFDGLSRDEAPRIFLPSLLADPDVVFFSGMRGDRIVATAIANRTDSVVGLSNVFARDELADACWPSVVRVASETFPGLSLVGYEQGGDLEAASAAGFEAIGPLRVWERVFPPRSRA